MKKYIYCVYVCIYVCTHKNSFIGICMLVLMKGMGERIVLNHKMMIDKLWGSTKQSNNTNKLQLSLVAFIRATCMLTKPKRGVSPWLVLDIERMLAVLLLRLSPWQHEREWWGKKKNNNNRVCLWECEGVAKSKATVFLVFLLASFMLEGEKKPPPCDI